VGDPVKRHNFFLPTELVDSLRKVAEARDTTVSDVIRGALEAWLKAYRKQQEAKNG
jgi:predicted transcriptional regulator